MLPPPTRSWILPVLVSLTQVTVGFPHPDRKQASASIYFSRVVFSDTDTEPESVLEYLRECPLFPGRLAKSCVGCAGRCGFVDTSLENSEERGGCSCDSICGLFGDCCWDFHASCPKESRQFDTSYSDMAGHLTTSCEGGYVVIGNTTRNDGYVGLDIGTFLVTSRRTRLTFRDIQTYRHYMKHGPAGIRIDDDEDGDDDDDTERSADDNCAGNRHTDNDRIIAAIDDCDYHYGENDVTNDSSDVIWWEKVVDSPVALNFEELKRIIEGGQTVKDVRLRDAPPSEDIEARVCQRKRLLLCSVPFFRDTDCQFAGHIQIPNKNAVCGLNMTSLVFRENTQKPPPLPRSIKTLEKTPSPTKTTKPPLPLLKRKSKIITRPPQTATTSQRPSSAIQAPVINDKCYFQSQPIVQLRIGGRQVFRIMFGIDDTDRSIKSSLSLLVEQRSKAMLWQEIRCSSQDANTPGRCRLHVTCKPGHLLIGSSCRNVTGVVVMVTGIARYDFRQTGIEVINDTLDAMAAVVWGEDKGTSGKAKSSSLRVFSHSLPKYGMVRMYTEMELPSGSFTSDLLAARDNVSASLAQTFGSDETLCQAIVCFISRNGVGQDGHGVMSGNYSDHTGHCRMSCQEFVARKSFVGERFEETSLESLKSDWMSWAEVDHDVSSGVRMNDGSVRRLLCLCFWLVICASP